MHFFRFAGFCCSSLDLISRIICTRIIGLFMKMHPIVSGETGAVKVYRFGFHTIDEKLSLVAVGKNDTIIISWQIKQMH
jgi:hypothetical protein